MDWPSRGCISTMGIRREECIVSACMLKEATPVVARRSSGDAICPYVVWSAYFKKDMR